MAVGKLGGIVTEIAGSIGGLNFRRYRGSTVLSNKSNGPAKSHLLNNKALPILRKVNIAWNNLTRIQKDDWFTASKNYQYPDKFGTLRHLTAKQFFTKLTSILLMADEVPPNPNTLDSNVYAMVVQSIKVKIGLSTTIEMVNYQAPVFVAIQVEQIKDFSLTPVFSRRKKIEVVRFANNGIYDFYETFRSIYPNAQVGDFFRFYVTQYNLDGFAGNVEYFDITAT